MNVYMVVEGRRTEPKVYPAWLSLLKPDFKRVDSPKLMTGNSYYLFSACGIPAIYNHIVNSVKDIGEIECDVPIEVFEKDMHGHMVSWQSKRFQA